MSLSQLARESAARAAPRPTPAAGVLRAQAQDDAFDTLARYLPTETVTLYVAALAAQATVPARIAAWLTPTVSYAVFAALTPALLLLLSYIRQREAEAASGTPRAPFRPHPWPPTASFIAFLIWALAVPGLLSPDDAKAWGGFLAFGALSISTLLTLIDRFVRLPRPAP